MTTTAERQFIWEKVKALPSCDHEPELRRRTIQGGSRPVYAQCVRCGKSLGARGSKHMPPHVLESLPPFDDAAHQAYVDDKEHQHAAMWQDARATQSGPWWDRYQEHMASPVWASKRRRVLMRDGHLCQACLKRPAGEVHHKTYKHFGHEPLFDLVAVCVTCHRALTAMERDEEGV